jgi:hypothetical protein
MIRVTVEMIPYGIEKHAEVIGQLKIINDGTGTKEVGNYTWEMVEEGVGLLEEGKCGNFNREAGVWALVERVLFDRIVDARKWDLSGTGETIDIMVDEKKEELDKIYNKFQNPDGTCGCPLCDALIGVYKK